MRTIVLIIKNVLLLVPMVFASLIFSFLPYALLKGMTAQHAFFVGFCTLLAFLYIHKRTDKSYRFIWRGALLSMLNIINGPDDGIRTFINMYVVLDAGLSSYFLSLQGRFEAFNSYVQSVNFLRRLSFAETPLHQQLRYSIAHQRREIDRKYP